MKAIENPKIKSIYPFLTVDVNELEKSLHSQPSFCLIDNMNLTKLRKDIDHAPLLLKGFSFYDVMILPDVILEEAARNIPDAEAFEKMYVRLFSTLAQNHTIYILELDAVFTLLKRMAGKQNALNSLKAITLEAVRINQKIADKVKTLNVNAPAFLDALRDAVVHDGKNAGERFITIYALVFLSLYYGPAYIFSEDKGTYSAFRTFIGNDRLLEIINVQNSTGLMEHYKFLSYESVIQSVHQSEKLSKADLIHLIGQCSRNQSRHILYSLDGYPCYSPISNKHLAEWIYTGKINIQF